MKSFKMSFQICLVVLLTVSILFTESSAQSATTLLTESIVLAQDTVPATRESKTLSVLDASLKSLSGQAHRDRMMGGYVLLGLGITSGIGGATILALAESDDARMVGYSLLGGAVILSGLSLLPFNIPNESERLYRDFKRMPEDTPDQIRQKFYYGERRFEELADKSRRDRFIGGGILILSGLTSSILTDAPVEDRIAAFLGPAIPGAVTLLVKTEVERAYDSYKRAKEDLVGRAGDLEIHLGIAPLPRGGILGVVQVRF